MIREYKVPAYSLAYRVLRNAEEAEETVQDAFFNAYKKIHQFKGDSKFASWFLKIVYNLSLTKVRRKKIQAVKINEEFDAPDEYNTSEINGWGLIMKSERETYVRRALEKLPADDALVLSLYYLLENSVQEICKITGWTQSSTKVKLHRARQKLYGCLFSILQYEMKELI